MDSNKQGKEIVQYVDIVLKPEKTIRIDSVTLRRCSGYFNKSLSSFWLDRSPAYGGGSDGVIVYELDLGSVPEEDFLILKAPEKESNEQQASVNGQIRSDCYFTALENLFKIFLHQYPVLPHTEDVIELVRLGDKYDSLQAVGGAVKATLFEYFAWPDELYRRILEMPLDYLWIGEKIKSDVVIMEASIHVIGKWSELSETCETTVSRKLFDSLENSHALLLAQMAKANLELLALDFDGEANSTESYSRYKSLSSVRENIGKIFKSNQRSSNPELHAGFLYRGIASIEWPDYDSDITTLAKKVKKIVTHLSVVRARLPAGSACPSYLLCARLQKKELPWYTN